MNTEQKTFYDVRNIPGDKLGVRVIADVNVVENGDVRITYSDETQKDLPEPTPYPVRQIVSAEIVNGDLQVHFDNSTKLNVGRVNPKYTNTPPAFSGTGLLTDAVTGKFKPLVGVGPFITITETVDKFKMSIDLSSIGQMTAEANGVLNYEMALSSTWKSTTALSDGTLGASFYIPGSNNTAWNNYDVSGLNYPALYPVTFNGDRSFVLPAGHYYMEFATQLTVEGVAELQLYDVTNNKVLLTGLGVESLAIADYSVHQCTVMRGEFYLNAPTTVMVRGKASSRFIYYGYGLNRTGITHHIGCTMLLWKTSDVNLNLNRNTPQLDNSWKQLTAVYNPASTVSTITGTHQVSYQCGTVNLYVNTVKAPSGANYIIPDAARAFVYMSDDGLVKAELGSPVDISSGTRPFGKHSTLGKDGLIYVPAYNAPQHVRIVPMPVGGWVRPVAPGGYDYFPRTLALYDPHITVTAPVPVAGHATALSLFQNNKGTGQANEYLSVATATPEIAIGMRLPVSLKGIKLSRGSYGLITAAEIYSVSNSVRTLLGSLTLVGNEMVAENLTGAPAKDYVIVILAATGSAGAVQFGCNGIQLIVGEQIDQAKFEGVVELIPGAANSTVTAKYEIAQSSPISNEIMFIPVTNFATRGGFEFYDTVEKRWRKDTMGLTIDAAYIFSCAICSPLNDHIYIFTRTAAADWYVYNPAKKVIKALPYMAVGVDCVVNGLDGRIYGAISNSNYFSVIDPVNHYTWSVGIGGTYDPTAEITQMNFGNDGILRVLPYNGVVYNVNLKTLFSTKEGTTTWWYINVRMLNGEYYAFIARLLSGSTATVSNYYYKRFTGIFTPDPRLQLGYYVN